MTVGKRVAVVSSN